MFRSFLKTAFRALWKNKGYSLLNIAGLAIGIACAGLIFLWVEHEMSYDRSYPKKDLLYQVKMNNDVDAGVFTHNSTPALMAPAIQTDIPGIVNTCRTNEGLATRLFTVGEKKIYVPGNYADPSVFSMFSLSFVAGNAHDAFSQLYVLVLTEKAAKKIFGTTDNTIGKTVRMDNKQDYVVTGIIKDLPENSTLQFEWLAPFQVLFQQYGSELNWNNFNTATYVELDRGIAPSAINAGLHDYIQVKQQSDKSTAHAFLFAMNDWHLRGEFRDGKQTGDGQIRYVRLFSIIAWIILLIACINFMNLATARSERRAREIGVRKVMGAGRSNLVVQFIGEALFLSLLSALLAIVIMYLLLPAFNTLVEKNLSLSPGRPSHIIALALLVCICGFVAGSYPSIYLSSFNPVYVLKGIKLKTGSAAMVRKGLVIMQFTVSIALIIATIIIYQQIQHVKSRDLGYNKNNLLQLDAPLEVASNFDAIRQDLLNTMMVENVALANHRIMTSGNNTTSVSWSGKDPDSRVVISQRLVSDGFMQTAGMHMVSGRGFTATDLVEVNENGRPKNPAQPINVIITASLEKMMGNGTAIGKQLMRETDIGTLHLHVIGVVKNYVYGDMYGQSDPVIFYNMPQEGGLLYVRIKASNDHAAALSKIAAVMKKDNPAYPFEYRFVDDEFNRMFINETLIGKLSRVFATLAILISCLGLFGLAAYTAERRTREIGIRKVLGASVPGITGLLSKDFLQLVTLSCLLAFPIAWWIMHNWLQNYEYRVGISWWIFLFSAAIAMIIALLTVSFQAIKAALVNPVASLRNE